MGFYTNRRWVVNDNRHRKIVHYIRTDTRNELLSIEAFPRQKKVHPFFHREREDEWIQISAPIYERLGMKFETHSHESLWDFYRFIGWDYRKKKWVSG